VLKFLITILALSLVSPASAQDTKAAADQLCHRLRQLQQPDGAYGSDLSETCRVLDVLGRSPRRYTELDGPFIRKGTRLVALAPAGSVKDSLVALALAATVTPELTAIRDAAVSRLEVDVKQADFEALLALRTLRPAFAIPGPDGTEHDAAVSCLRAADPESVPPPPVTDVPAWTRWARAARLRGLKPTELPPIPEPADSAGVPELVAALETVIQMHALPASAGSPSPGISTSSGSLPVRVAPGQSLEQALDRATAFFDARQVDGTFGLGLPGWIGPEAGVTALCLSAAMSLAELRHQPRPSWIDSGLDYLKALQHEDGSIREQGLDVYTTSVAIEALVMGGREGDRDVIEKARRFLLVAQSDEGEGYEKDADIYYGGVGYGNDERPDLSNLQFAVEAAAQAGTPTTDSFFTKARVYLERCQNLSEAGAVEWPRPAGGVLVMGNDGGATYMPGNSEAGEIQLAEGRYQAVSYGSMTYSLVKSFLFCDVPPEDQRVQAAVRWLARNFTVDRNPGFLKADAASDGLFYYYLSMARTLRMLNGEDFRDDQGNPIPWRAQLSRQLLDSQLSDGSWTNDDSKRWWESAPTLCTAYAVLALAAASK